MGRDKGFISKRDEQEEGNDIARKEYTMNVGFIPEGVLIQWNALDCRVRLQQLGDLKVEGKKSQARGYSYKINTEAPALAEEHDECNERDHDGSKNGIMNQHVLGSDFFRAFHGISRDSFRREPVHDVSVH